jgi:hypothetical protein
MPQARVTDDLERAKVMFLEQDALEEMLADNPALHAWFALILDREFVGSESRPALDLLRRRRGEFAGTGGR